MGREALSAPELAPTPDEEVGDLDDVALDAPGHGGNLAHDASTVTLEGRMDDDVDR